MDLLSFLHRPRTSADQAWTLVGVGDPALEQLEQRENLGRHILVRWAIDTGKLNAPATHLATGTLYQAHPRLQVFMPEVPIRSLGTACRELLSGGVSLQHLVLVATDLRLPLGHGRLRLSGPADHPGVRQVAETLQTPTLARVVLGVGPMDGPREAYLAQRWTDTQWERLPQVEATFARFMALLLETSRLSDLAPVVNGVGFWPWDHRHPRRGRT